MKRNIAELQQFLDELEGNMTHLIGGFYGIVVIEGELTSTFNEASDFETKKRIIEDAQNVVTSTRKMIEDVTTTNKNVCNQLKIVPEDGKKHAVQEHLKLRERVLIDMEAYIISIESQINDLKNEI